MLTWTDDGRFELGDATFLTMPLDLFQHTKVQLREGEFFLFKPRSAVELYVALIGELEPQHIFELGIFHGGSTLFFAELARPRKIVAIDRMSPERFERLEDYAAGRGLAAVVRTYSEVDQADRPKLAEIVATEFEGRSLDLVVDDCSHLYEPTKASFNELFPRLRPGGAYVVEDWGWAHIQLGSEYPEGLHPAEVPLSRLLFEIVLAVPGLPGLISEISVGPQAAVIRRGDATVDPATFDISACSNPRGRALLAPA